MNPMDAKLASGAWRPCWPRHFRWCSAPMVRAWSKGEPANRARRFSRGDELFGQFLIAPLGSSGTYAEEYVAVS